MQAGRPPHASLSFLWFAFWILLACESFAAPPPPSWTVADAPFRIILKLTKAPEIPEAGIEINIPEFGQTRADLTDLLLTDAEGKPQPLARIGRRTGGRVLLLAQKMETDTPYFLYFGGDKPRALPDWTPKVSLLMETRPAPGSLNFDSLQSLKNAWSQSQEAPGAGFVSMIYQGGNPFGPNMNFLTHYTGFLRLPKAREITFYTLSSDCSFVVINDQEQFGWPGRHTPSTTPASVAKKTVSCAEGLVKIDYYAAKGDIPPEERLEAATVLGWQTDTGFEAIPREAWLHPGSSQIAGVQTILSGSTPAGVPMTRASVESFVGFAGQWYYEIKYELRAPQNQEWQAAWTFEDGATATGSNGSRLLTGHESQTLKCALTRGSVTLTEPFRIDVPDRLQRASINDPNDIRRYLGMILAEDASKLSADSIRARLLLLNEFGSDQDIAKYAENWAERNQNDTLWVPVRLAAIRSHAQTDPARARQEFLNFVQFLEPVTQKAYATEIAAAEMDLLVFCLRDPEAFGRLTQISFQNSDNSLSRVAKIRVGDLHRLLGNYKESAAQYQSLGSKTKDQAQPVKDSAASIAIRDLLDKGFNKDAQTKLLEWEQRRPMVKFDSDFLLLRARTLMAFGRWNEAQTELESFQKVQPDSPFQIEAQFQIARILYEKGSKEEARKLWNAFAKDYPKHPLASQAREWADKP